MAEQWRRVLLVDDDEDDFLMFRDLLSETWEQKFSVEWASSFEQGKACLQQKDYDVCFLDYRLGIKTGLDFLQEAIAEGIKVPMILLTGYGEREVDLEAMRLGAADYLIKDQISSFLLERSIRYSIHRAQAIQAIFDREAQIVMQDRLASIGLLASSLAHEIGTPLGVIRGRAEYLEMQFKEDASTKKSLDIIVTQIDRVSKLIRSLLNLARGDHTIAAERVRLDSIVLEVLDLMGHEISKHEIEIRNEFQGNMPVPVKAEAGPLHQVLINLLLNSMHAIETAKKRGRLKDHFVRIYSHELPDQWALCVEDSGCGIEEKNMKNLFKPFFTTKDVGIGTGLGLATSYRIVASWGGVIHVKSKEGVGTEFQVLLPKAEEKKGGLV